jgi:prephenate dehydrogenase
VIIQRLAIVGTGLIGGSFALALKQAGAVGEVLGVGRNPASLEAALERGLIDRVADWAEAGQADCILLALPVGETAAVLKQLVPHLKPAAIVTDAGSTKVNVLAAAHEALGERHVRFVAGHPIAGSEQSGPGAARADLYQGKKVVLTPEADTDTGAIASVRALWEATGAQVETLEAGLHDRVFAAVSHLPHLAAFALVDELARREDGDTFFHLPPAAFATSPASPAAARRCGATSRWPIARRCSPSSTPTCRPWRRWATRWPIPTPTPCWKYSRAPVRRASDGSTSGNPDGIS